MKKIVKVNEWLIYNYLFFYIISKQPNNR